MDLKWFESKVGNKYLNEAAGLAAEKEAASKDTEKKKVHCYFIFNTIFMYNFTQVSLYERNSGCLSFVCRILPHVWEL